MSADFWLGHFCALNLWGKNVIPDCQLFIRFHSTSAADENLTGAA